MSKMFYDEPHTQTVDLTVVVASYKLLSCP